MKKYILTILISVAGALAMPAGSRAADGDLFPYPVPPEDMQVLSQRCNYIIDNFWKRCDFKSAMSTMDKFNRTFGDWVQLMPYASADTVHMVIDRLIDNTKKSGPQTLTIARLAEGWLYSDTAEIRSEEIYLPFARAAATNKKVPSADRKYFEKHVKIIESSGLDATVPNLEFTRPDGSTGYLHDITAPNVLIIISTPDCLDCRLDAVRLGVDLNTNKLIEEGGLQIVNIFDADPASTEWKERAESLPKEWTVGAIDNIDEYFNLRSMPAYCFTTAEHKVIANNLRLDNIIYALGRVRQ